MRSWWFVDTLHSALCVGLQDSPVQIDMFHYLAVALRWKPTWSAKMFHIPYAQGYLVEQAQASEGSPPNLCEFRRSCLTHYAHKADLWLMVLEVWRCLP